MTSKVGTKLSALKLCPEQYLEDFWKSLDKHEQDLAISKAENYLVKVTKPGTPCTTMDELRYTLYHQRKAMDLSELPPTSAAIRLHILRCIYVCYMQMHCLIEVTANPKDFGSEKKDGLLLQSNPKVFVPKNLVLVCSCTKCSTKRCVCRKAGVPCCIYCQCKSGKSDGCCKNPHVLLSVPMVL
ncbi:hypothetical protein DPMN_175712 [Dreissena polymorpha]|uniref:Uncharacterized protein n=1 Tax=Dreissena polymorpha TaxID=45954 RepID=A0A9D4IJW1_DREPO|nr:hypothetical protein DPMN_175712 [Dreissena polymorpha]